MTVFKPSGRWRKTYGPHINLEDKTNEMTLSYNSLHIRSWIFKMDLQFREIQKKKKKTE